jgi:alpha-methylacyl-CoA racemase
MLLADLGAEVLRIERPGTTWPDVPIVSRGRASISLDLKNEGDLDTARRAIQAADVLVEGFRPGVMERIGLCPKIVSSSNPSLIFARMTGWGQEGPLAQAAGHDINFIGLTGMLSMLGKAGEAPTAPQNFLGDYGAGGTYLALGVLAALFERNRSGLGQVVDAAIVDGSVSMLAPMMGMVAGGLMPSNPADGMLAGRAPNYRSYACADGRFLAVGPLEPQFRRALETALGVPENANYEILEEKFLTRPRDFWVKTLEDVDCCVSPILDLHEAQQHPHLQARRSFITQDGHVQPAAAPRFSRTPGAVRSAADSEALLKRWNLEN